MKNIITPRKGYKQDDDLNDEIIIALAKQYLFKEGWVLLRGFNTNLNKFSELFQNFCQKITFDPAREFADETSQKVNAGKESVGLHIENGNTPFPPHYVGFYSKKSAQYGSQTTICDGRALFKNMPEELQRAWLRDITVSRQLPAHLWRKYVASQHPSVNDISEVNNKHLADFIAANPKQRGTINSDGSLAYELDIQPCLGVEKAGQLRDIAFANAILGPSFNYEKPSYFFSNGEKVSQRIKNQTADLAEKYTHEISWQNGDVVLIDNKRVMHGRRVINGELSERQLFIAMGT